MCLRGPQILGSGCIRVATEGEHAISGRKKSADLPDGLFGSWTVQPHLQKYFLLRLTLATHLGSTQQNVAPPRVWSPSR